MYVRDKYQIQERRQPWEGGRVKEDSECNLKEVQGTLI